LAHRQRVFVVATTVAGLAVLAWAIARGAGHLLTDADDALVILSVAILVAEVFPLDIPGREEQVTFSTPFAFALMLDRGVAVTIVVTSLLLLVADVARRRSVERTLFNVAQYAISYGAAGAVLTVLGGPTGTGTFRLADLPALAAAGMAFLLLNSSLATAPPALADGRSLLDGWRDNLGFELWSTAVLVGLAPIVLIIVDDHAALSPLLALPLAAIQLGARHATVNHHRARHDTLTGLPNRVQLTDRLADELARRPQAAIAVVLLDLDGFNEVNDTLGLAQGDALLRHVAARLRAETPPADMVARLGGDEFAVLTRRAGDAAPLAESVLATLRAPVRLQGLDLDVRASAGVACHPRDGDDAESLLVHAAMALHLAQERGRPWASYDRALDRDRPERMALAAELRHAIDAGELLLHYQPKLDLRTGRVDSVEALVRWRHPLRGLLLPTEFIALAEHTGLVRPLTDWALAEAVSQQRRWAETGLDLAVAVNVSARALAPDLPRAIARLLDAHPGVRLELEVTESATLEDSPDGLAILDELARLGVRLAVDDFGTGYASLAYLKRLPIDEIKIDRDFVTAMDADRGDLAIVRATIDIGRHLGLDVVAEGVESSDVLAELQALGCAFAQGFAVARPMAAGEMATFAASNA
jgi:diguanylate cyclase (GGDEF)-like protein